MKMEIDCLIDLDNQTERLLVGHGRFPLVLAMPRIIAQIPACGPGEGCARP